MGIIVDKFGGSSLADANQFRKVKAILFANPDRHFVVPSAPGKRDSDDIKVTDMLYSCFNLVNAGKTSLFEETYALLRNRYLEIIDDLQMNLDFSEALDKVHDDILGGASVDYAASRGEFLNGIILAAFLGWEFIDAAEVIFFDEDGKFDEEKTQKVLSERLEKAEYAVIPGFYGSNPDRTVRTFSRGGSDMTGAIVSRAAAAELYENWTDVSGVLMADPRIVKRPKHISVITYRELRELSYMGFSVLHEDAIFPVRMAGIPINIRNTNAPDDPGTMIVRADASHVRGAITGIAGMKGFTAIAIEKNRMNKEVGFGMRVLSALSECGVPVEHLPTGIDTMTVVVSDSNIAGSIDTVVEKIRTTCRPDHIEVITGLSLIATVGRGMVRYPGTAAKIFGALADAGINIRMIDQGSSELNIITGVETVDFERAINAIYNAFNK